MKKETKKVTKKPLKKTPAKGGLVLAGIALEEIGIGSLVRIDINVKDKITTVELMKNTPDFFNLKSKDIKK